MDCERQYNFIHRFFKLTTEPYDTLDWDGKTLQIILNNEVIEIYDYKALCEIINDFC